MTAKQSAGILVYKKVGGEVRVLLVHPGGPFWAKKDFWSVPKGELNEGEEPLAAAKREFAEELGFVPPEGELVELGTSRGKGKTNIFWALEGDVDLSKFKPGTFEMEWPPKSGKTQEFPEDDRAEWFDLATAKQKVFKNQDLIIDRLAVNLNLAIESLDKQTLKPTNHDQTQLL